jgi:hypothetical protein
LNIHRLIAIMLGRLEMSIEDCLEAFKTMSAEIFARNWKVAPIIKHIGAIAGTSRFKAKNLETAIKKVLRELEMAEDVSLRDSGERSCKV